MTELKWDTVKIEDMKYFSKLLEPDEKLVCSLDLIKINDRKSSQRRTFVLTTKAIYNYSKTKMRRKILVKTVTAIINSRLSNEFVVHVESEYDYLYETQEKGRVFSYLRKVFKDLTKKNLPFFEMKEASLFPFTTTKADKKRKLIKLPKDICPCFYDDEDIDDGKSRKSTLFNKDKDKETFVSMDDFNIKGDLGVGTMCRIKLVEKKDTKTLYALKSIYKAQIESKKMAEHIIFEKKVMEHMNHQFLVNLVYSFQTKYELFFVIKFMRGGDLFFHMQRNKRFSEPRARFYFIEIALGLEFLHSQNIVYRDIKAENILMDEEGHVALTDFGMAKFKESEENENYVICTPEYTAPEVLREGAFTYVSDWWSMGILLYEMIVGIPPFYSNNRDLMVKLILEFDTHYPKKIEINPDCKNLIDLLLAKDPKNRIGANGGLKEIKTHPWFKDINWQAYEDKKISPPFKPQKSIDLFEYFDTEYIHSALSSYPIQNFESTKQKNFEDDFKEFYFPQSNTQSIGGKK